MKTHTTDKLIEYMNIHLISLNQDMDNIDELYSNDWHYLQGQIFALEYLLKVANEFN
jgi:hypothetical protein